MTITVEEMRDHGFVLNRAPVVCVEHVNDLRAAGLSLLAEVERLQAENQRLLGALYAGRIVEDKIDAQLIASKDAEIDACKRRDKDRICAWEAKVSEKDGEITRLTGIVANSVANDEVTRLITEHAFAIETKDAEIARLNAVVRRFESLVYELDPGYRGPLPSLQSND